MSRSGLCACALMLSTLMLSTLMLSTLMLSTLMLSTLMLSTLMLSTLMLSTLMLSSCAPFRAWHFDQWPSLSFSSPPQKTLWQRTRPRKCRWGIPIGIILWFSLWSHCFVWVHYGFYQCGNLICLFVKHQNVFFTDTVCGSADCWCDSNWYNCCCAKCICS